MQPQVTSKLPDVGTTIFTVMSQMAAEHQAINLSQGFPDFEIDTLLLDKVHFYHQKGYHQYAPMPGIAPLRKNIAAIYEHLYQVHYSPDTEVLVTSGASEAIFSSIAALIQKGDEVVIFEPAYDLYAPAVNLFGGNVVPVSTYAPHFDIDWSVVAAKITDKTRLIIINNPNNPTGKMWSKADFEALEKLVVQHDLWVLSDEVYAHIVVGDKPFYSVCEFEALQKRSIITASFGKLLHATGWKVGYCIAPQYLMHEIKKVHQFNVFTVNHALQHAIADYIQNAQVYLGLSDFFKPKRTLLAQGLTSLGFDVLPTDGTYFMTASYAGLSRQSDTAFAKHLIETYKVAAIPVSAFYGHQHDDQLLRFCFAKEDATLRSALDNLQTLKKV